MRTDESFALLLGAELSAERLQGAAAVALPIQQKIAQGALDKLAFDDSPADYTALLLRR